MPHLRPMTSGDDRAVVELMQAAFADLERRLAQPPGAYPPGDPAIGALRVRHLVATDPQGAWAAEEDGELVGAALAIVREGIWGLSLLVVHPRAQSAGLGQALLDRALGHAGDGRGGLILSSEDPRALRLYHRAGFRLRPTMDAIGTPLRRPSAPGSVRPGRWPEDREIVDAAGRAVRGAGHGRDIATYLQQGAELLVHEAGGFAVHRGGELKLLAAHGDGAAADLLRAALNATPPHGRTAVEFIASDHDWAVEVVLDAGLELRPGGAIFVRGRPGPLQPYLPSGAYL